MSANKGNPISKAPDGVLGKLKLPVGLDQEIIYRFLRYEGGHWLRDSNIIGISVGEKKSDGTGTGVAAVLFEVVGKLQHPADIIRAGSRPIPASLEIGGITLTTDVREAWPRAHAMAPEPRKSKVDPLIGGVSIGSTRETGTLGAILWHKPSGQPVALSNWHVLAINPDDPTTFQPGRADTNGQRIPMGSLKDKELSLELDAAISIIQGRGVRGEIAGLSGGVTGVRQPQIGDLVAKSGKESEVTYGRVEQLHVRTSYDVWLPELHEIMVFSIKADLQRPPPTGEIAEQGDSGSCWMFAEEGDGRITGDMVGLHVAGDAGLGLAYACYADKVFQRFGLEPLGARTLAPSEALLAPGKPPALHKVIARDGLLIRSGPGREFPDKGGLPFGATVRVIGQRGDWSMVDLQGDGKADGFMHGSLLAPAAGS